MPRFFAMLCLQKMRNGMGRPHAGFSVNALFCKKTLAWAKRRYNSPSCAPAVFYEKQGPMPVFLRMPFFTKQASGMGFTQNCVLIFQNCSRRTVTKILVLHPPDTRS
jgi:hypothetical protein